MKMTLGRVCTKFIVSLTFMNPHTYKFRDRPRFLIVDEVVRRCRPPTESDNDRDESVLKYIWMCSYKCKPHTKSEVHAILKLKASFNGTVHEVCKVLDTCDECPNDHYSKVIFEDDESAIPTLYKLKGHSLHCYTGSECSSMLRIE